MTALPHRARNLAVAAAAALLLTPYASAQVTPASSPFGPNVSIFTASTPQVQIQSRIKEIYAQQEHSEFGSGRYALLFLPGSYNVDVPVGFYTQVLGLGATPDAVHITGDVHADASLPKNNATCTFWRSAEGFSVTPTAGPLQWAVSQAVAFRRMHVLGDMVLHQHRGWASGGWISDSIIDGVVDSGSQQQWLSRNTEWHSWTGSNWNMVFVGVSNPPAGKWPSPPDTVVPTAPVIREKPFLIADAHGAYSMVVPAVQRNTSGVSWHGGGTPGRALSLSSFYIAQPARDTAATINTALANGKNLIFTPGIYELTEPIRVTRPNTVVYGLGFATLRPTRGTAAMTVADRDGILVSGLLFDAGETRSPVLLEVGPNGSHARHIDDPITLSDVFFRVGGAAAGKVAANLVINANDVLVDHTWIWRADHGQGVGWTENTSDNGLIVNGNYATIYGLFVEHHQQFQVLWNGEHGRTFFYQSEIPYDPPTQQAWNANIPGSSGPNGWASYKVADNVLDHQAFGLGVYSVFRHPGVILTHAIETPTVPSVHFEHMVTIALDNLGEITHVVDNTGAAATPAPTLTTPRVATYPPVP
ncbi:MAG: coagulation factor 5/8 type domain-containing protein [Acidobacteriota bacterium]|nr:coagulation factor 5/8 type domain-containing protein [Acidobacteriota bacterium]